jgi:hypothetical protein
VASETYCPRCGGLVNSVTHACIGNKPLVEMWEKHPVGTGAELERLRGIEARLRDDEAAEDIGTRGMWPDEAIDTYRRAILGAE